MFKTLLALTLALNTCALAPQYAKETKEPLAIPKPTVVLDYIVKIECANERVGGSGTAFYIGNGQFVTALHVVKGTAICIESKSGAKLLTVKTQEDRDIALLEVEDTKGFTKEGFTVNCEGFQKNKSYYSFGYAAGRYFFMNELVATKNFTDDKYEVAGIKSPGYRVLNGLVIPGMSGGPIIDLEGEVIGINNITSNFGSKAMSSELKSTFLCPQGKK